jgi:hypothetical protein
LVNSERGCSLIEGEKTRAVARVTLLLLWRDQTIP